MCLVECLLWFSFRTFWFTTGSICRFVLENNRCGIEGQRPTNTPVITVAGLSQKGRRLGRWPAWEEARTLLQAPNPRSIRGMRDRALLGVLVTCALRRGELSRMNCEHLTMRDGRAPIRACYTSPG
jgi:integrase